MSSLIDAPPVSGRLPDDDLPPRIIHFDATQPRKERMRKAAAGETMPAVPAVATGFAPRAEPSRPPVSNVPAQHLPEPPQAVPSEPSVTEEARADTGLTRADLERVLIDFVVEQTGYPAEMVELDVDLEADLGIDSIKKAQLFGELAEQFGIQPPADASDLSLDDFPTLGHVANFLEQAAKGQTPQPAVTNGTVEAPTPTTAETPPPSSPVSAGNVSATPSTAAAPLMSAAEMETFLVNFVVEQTGYPSDMVELDADLEADLGIDSIKKAQLFGELAEQFGIQPPADASELSLDDFPTLRHVVGFLQSAAGEAVNSQSAATPVSQKTITPAATMTTTDSATKESPGIDVRGCAVSESAHDVDLERFLIDFVVEQTGYPAEMVELDADLEADLGIDSIKKAQLFGELTEYFEVQATEDLSLDDFPTLGHVRNFLRNVPRKATV